MFLLYHRKKRPKIKEKGDFKKIIFFLLAGTRVAFRNAIFGGLLLGLIQLVEVGMIKWNMRREMQMYHKMHEEQMEKQTQQLKEMRPGLIRKNIFIYLKKISSTFFKKFLSFLFSSS